MSLVDGVTARCLAVAARRWPADIRDDQAAEWGAELHAMANNPGAGRLTRAIRRLRFAASLAASPPVEDENGVPRGWREFLPAWSRMVGPALALIGMGMASGLLAGITKVTGGTLGGLLFGFAGTYVDSPPRALGKVAAGLLACAATAFLLGWAGTVVSRRLALVTAPKTASRRAFAALGAVVLVAVGSALNVFVRGAAPNYDWFGFVLWMVVCAAVCVGVVFIARGGMRWIARTLGVAGALVLLDLVAVEIGVRWATAPLTGTETAVPARFLDMSSAPLWFPLSLGAHQPGLFRTPHESVLASTGEVAWALSGTMTTYLLALVFLVGFTVRSAQAVVALPAPESEHAVPVRRRAVPLRPRLAALAGAVAALGTWAYAASFVVSRVDMREETPELVIWNFELRLAAVLSAMLALAYALNGRGRPLLPALLGGLALLVSDVVLVAADLPDRTAFVLAGALAAAVASGVWRLAHTLATSPQDAATARRGQILIALLASYAAPLLYAQMFQNDTRPFEAPLSLPLGTAVVTAGTIALGMTAAVTARVRPLSRVRAVALIIVPAVLFAAVGVIGSGDRADVLFAAGTLALPMLMLAYTVACWDRVRRRALRLALIAVLFGPAMAAQFLLDVLGAYLGGMAVSESLMSAAGTGVEHDGVPFLIGALFAGLPLVVLGARRAVPPPKARPVRVGRLTTV